MIIFGKDSTLYANIRRRTDSGIELLDLLLQDIRMCQYSNPAFDQKLEDLKAHTYHEQKKSKSNHGAYPAIRSEFQHQVVNYNNYSLFI